MILNNRENGYGFSKMYNPMKYLALILILICPSAFGKTVAEDVQSFTLENGMKILVLEDHSIPNANMYFFWKVGSRNENLGITGLSHFFEHMMFNGAKKYGPKMFDNVMEANGGANNAYTNQDVTVYTDWFPSTAMEIIFDLESDRIRDLALDSAMVESERGVVYSEYTTYLENSNYSLLRMQVQSTAFFAHPYRWPVIGYESDILGWNRDDLLQYFKTYYAPNNCVVVLVGDLDFENVKALAKEYFEPIPAQSPPQQIRTKEPPQNGEKRVMVHKKVSTPSMMITYHVPEAIHDDYYALDLFSSILSEGNSSRLRKSLIFDKNLAVSLFTYMPRSFDPNLFTIYVASSADSIVDILENEIFSEISGIIENGITERELQKVKNQKLMEFYKGIETINGKASMLGNYELFFGDYKKLFTAADLYNKVTMNDIKRVAETYFKPENRTVGMLISPEIKP
ncbi:MAG: insulinase family protein [Bacteroidales bacterium]|nr:insulinase family protein [Bacteroidales bacterium]